MIHRPTFQYVPMKLRRAFWALLLVFLASGCREILEPRPVDLLIDELVLNEASDVEPVRLGLYNAFRRMGALNIVAGDFTADFVQHNGTFTVYNELGNKQITAANAAAEEFWENIYYTAYAANFLLENLEKVRGVPEATRKLVLAEAHFLRGYAYFVGVNTFGDIPLVTTTDVLTNRSIAKSSRADILALVLQDYEKALPDLPDLPENNDNRVIKSFASRSAVRAALARYHLYQGSWALAEQFATEVISSNRQTLPPNFRDVILAEFDVETIFEVGYANNLSDDPGTSTFGLNNVLVGRREMIPANTYILQMLSPASGERRQTIAFNSAQQRGNDNGWSVRKHGTADEANNNITIFRLAELFLIRAEARARQGRLAGTNGAQADVNALRTRAKAPTVSFSTVDNALSIIEQERVFELSFEGHRWYDLKRTGRAQAVMSAFSPNWDVKFELWPIPLTEIQRNPSLSNGQNPGY